ncbi:aminoacetone oxidase family FAD-binding enzyme [Candidatus Dojkabacteria bacterium]|nr:aminoacetone oxidase family FAD-binding enzyme [Candidatus Dojkabacteria bacterium]
MIYETAIIGGGPAGMISAIQAAGMSKNPKSVILLEKNPDLGKKLLITGKGRCNLTTNEEPEEIVKAFGRKGKFLYGSLSRFSNHVTKSYFEGLGVPLVVERGNRVFPKSGKSIDVLNALKKELNRKEVEIRTSCEVLTVQIAPEQMSGGKMSLTHDSEQNSQRVEQIFDNSLQKRMQCLSMDSGSIPFIIKTHSEKIFAKKLIIATGGKSYPTTGSTGDGFAFARRLGHTVTRLSPALVHMIVKSKEIRGLAGLSLKNVELGFYAKFDREEKSKILCTRFGEMLFTHKGISGPIVLDSSKIVGKALKDNESRKVLIFASIDLKPALTEKQLMNRINREVESTPKSEYKTLLKRLLPRSLIDTAILRTHIEARKRLTDITREEKSRLIALLTAFEFLVDDVGGVEEGIVTCGGISLKEIDPRTMQSKLIPGLYFAGEVLDLDGPTGGYNLQAAWSTGFVAGVSCCDGIGS